MPRQNLPPKEPDEVGDKLVDEGILDSDKSESEASTKTSSSDSGIEDGKSTPTLEEDKDKVASEIPETEQPPCVPQSDAPEERVNVVPDPDVPKVQVTEENSAAAGNGDSPPASQSPATTPAATPASFSAHSPSSSSSSGLNGSISKGTAERTSTGGHAGTISSYPNGGIFDKRYSYSGSMVSESMDMSINKESISAHPRVSPCGAKLSPID